MAKTSKQWLETANRRKAELLSKRNKRVIERMRAEVEHMRINGNPKPKRYWP